MGLMVSFTCGNFPTLHCEASQLVDVDWLLKAYQHITLLRTYTQHHLAQISSRHGAQIRGVLLQVSAQSAQLVLLTPVFKRITRTSQLVASSLATFLGLLGSATLVFVHAKLMHARRFVFSHDIAPCHELPAKPRSA